MQVKTIFLLTTFMQVKLLLSELSEVFLKGRVSEVKTSFETLTDTLGHIEKHADKKLVKQVFWDLDIFNNLAQTMLTGVFPAIFSKPSQMTVYRNSTYTNLPIGMFNYPSKPYFTCCNDLYVF